MHIPKQTNSLPPQIGSYKQNQLAALTSIATLLLAYCVLLSYGCGNSYDGGTVYRYQRAANAIPGSTYDIQIYEPDSASRGATLPALFLLDGDQFFEPAAKLVDEQYKDKKLPAMYVISIGYGDQANHRVRDYTYDSPYEEVDGGGVTSFFDFLEGELIPWVIQKHAISSYANDHVLLGHSYGGIAAMYNMFERQIFRKNIALSPTLRWGQGLPFEREQFYADHNNNLSAGLYLAAGERETHGMAALAAEMGRRLESRRYPSLKLKWEILAQATHIKTFKPGLESGLHYFYGRDAQ